VIINTTDSNFIRTEIGLTHEFINYLKNNKESAMSRITNVQEFIPVKKWDAGQLADTIYFPGSFYFIDESLRKSGTPFELKDYNSTPMFPLWFFIVLIIVISCLLFITRRSNESFTVMRMNHVRRLQFWWKNVRR
jgi:hypothetical protein